MEPGRVIEIIEGRSFMTAVVTRVKGAKLQILGENDREMSISANRVLYEDGQGLNPTLPRNDLVRTIKEISARRSFLSNEFNIIELWELLEGEGENFSFDFLAELAWPGPTGSDHVAATLRTVFADGIYFKMKPDGVVRNSGEKVEQLLQAREREAEKERELSEGGTWLASVWKDGYGYEPDCRDRVVRILRDMVLYSNEAKDYKWGQKLLEKAGLNNDPLTSFNLLVKTGEMGRHENLDLLREGISTDFSAAVLKEAESLSRDSSWQDENRRDLTQLELITADSGGAKDYDDAVSLDEKDGRLILGVHIADVSALVKPNTALDLEARSRATSIYMPDRRIPMLPEILSEECLSLREGEARPAFSMMAEISEAGEILSYEFFPSVVKIKRQLSYQEVDGAVDHDLVLSRMFALSKIFKARRIANGALLLPLPKMNVYLTPEGEVGVGLTLWENPGRSMISEFMIVANWLAARHLFERDVPCLYRSQDEPSERIVPGDTDCAELFPCLRQRRFLSRVIWSLDPQPHTGMGLDVYTNVSSPIRRYFDLMIQRQIKLFGETGRILYEAEEMEAVLTEVEAARRKALKIQNNRRRYWMLRYIEAQPSKEYEALVVERLPHRWRIFLTDLFLDVDLPHRSGQKLEPGEIISVRVRKVSPREDILKFELV